MLCFSDEWAREALAKVVDRSLSEKRLLRELDDLIRWHGHPGMVVSDNETEMTSHAVLKWCQD